MATTIHATARSAKVEETVRETLRRATARGGAVAAAAQSRLGEPLAAVDTAVATDRAAHATAATALAGVMAEKAKCDGAIGVVRDAMWNALDRPRAHPAMDAVFPSGMKAYTTGNPTEQPVMMQVLHSRILSGAAPQWTREMLDGWAATIDGLRTSLLAAVEAHRPARAAASVAHLAYRSAVRTAHARLADFKRDLKSMGQTEAQIGDLIPDAGRPAGRAPAPAPVPAESKPVTPITPLVAA